MSSRNMPEAPLRPVEGEDEGKQGRDPGIAVRVSNLSKCYQIYSTPRDRLKQFVMPKLRRAVSALKGASRQSLPAYYREFWALSDVSFEVRKGETLGVIGRNGSGKSTLLQLICGTLRPTSGSVETRGRVAALLELGSGFNPEFTGRENVYINASVLGLSRDQIDERFDSIASFSDMGQFIDQPVKTYSSGMYVRLAFAVIAHVDADILVVDEALAVGDAVFIQKCMRFIRGFQEHGTLIFVSHDVASVQNLCKSGIWLNNGRIARAGTAKIVAETYLQYTLQEIYGEEAKLTSMTSAAADGEPSPDEIAANTEVTSTVAYGAVASVRDNINRSRGWKSGNADIVSVALTRLSPGLEGMFEGGERVRIIVRARTHVPLQNPILGFLVRDRLGQDLFGENTLPFTKRVPTPIEAGMTFEGIFEFRLPALPNGQYAVAISVADGDLSENVQHHWMHDALIINVSSSRVRFGLVGIPFGRVGLRIVG